MMPFKNLWRCRYRRLEIPKARELARYGHALCVHGEHIVDFFEEYFPGLAPQDMNCQAGEHINKIIKQEFAPMAGMLRVGRLENAFYHIMRDWQIGAVPEKPGIYRFRALFFRTFGAPSLAPMARILTFIKIRPWLHPMAFLGTGSASSTTPAASTCAELRSAVRAGAWATGARLASARSTPSTPRRSTRASTRSVGRIETPCP
jgi:hypothetical protein